MLHSPQQIENVVLELRPTCEHCNKKLPPDSAEAMICTYECTFCNSCVEHILEDVCPNCGGGFSSRPIRPSKELAKGTGLNHHPASTKIIYKPLDINIHKGFIAKIKTGDNY